MMNRALLFLGAVACSENQLSKLEDTGGRTDVPVPEFVTPELQPDCYNWDHAMDAPRRLNDETKANMHQIINQAIVDPEICDGDALCRDIITSHNVLVGEALSWASENAECVAYSKEIFHYNTWDGDPETLSTEVVVRFWGESGLRRIRMKYANLDENSLLMSTEYDGDASIDEPDVRIDYREEYQGVKVSQSDYMDCPDRECPAMELYDRLVEPAYDLRMTTYYDPRFDGVLTQSIEWPMDEFVDGCSPWWYNR